MIKKIAAYRLEQGCSLGLLEQISGSQTLGNAVATQFRMGTFSTLTVVLLAIWSLSPIGSQSSLQFLTTNLIPVTTNTSIVYFDTCSQNGWPDEESATKQAYSLYGLYTSLLLAPPSTQNSSMDVWGNVKIPDLVRLALNATANSTGWLDASTQTNITYSSLLGIPITSPPTIGTTNFNMQSSYFMLDCLNNTAGNGVKLTALDNELQAKRQTIANLGFEPPSDIYYGIISNNSFSIATNGFLDVTQETSGPEIGGIGTLINNTSQWNARTLLFQSYNGSSTAQVYCTITTKFLESAVTCAGKACQVTAVRPSRQKNPNSNFTDWNFRLNFYTFSDYFINSGNSQSTGLYAAAPGSTPMEFFLRDPFSVLSGGSGYANLSEVDVDLLGVRLQQLINAYWWGGVAPQAMLAGTPEGCERNVAII
jgi:hypothetical protein